MGPVETFTIADAAGRTGLTTHTLRYYERAGLMLDAVARAPSTHRRYTEDELRWVEFITRLRTTGMPIRTIRRYVELMRAGDDTEAQRMALLEEHRREVMKRLNQTVDNLNAIEAKIELYRRRAAERRSAAAA